MPLNDSKALLILVACKHYSAQCGEGSTRQLGKAKWDDRKPNSATQNTGTSAWPGRPQMTLCISLSSSPLACSLRSFSSTVMGRAGSDSHWESGRARQDNTCRDVPQRSAATLRNSANIVTATTFTDRPMPRGHSSATPERGTADPLSNLNESGKDKRREPRKFQCLPSSSRLRPRASQQTCDLDQRPLAAHYHPVT